MRLTFLVLAVALAVACGGGDPVPEQPGPDQAKGFSLPKDGDLPGWSRVTEAESFEAENLWEYINGQADFFIDYGFVRVDTAEYQNDQEANSVVLEIYTMGRPENAFGIFAAERTEDDRSVEIGNGAYLGPNVLGFWHGERYVKLTSFDEGQEIEEMLVGFAEAISSLMPGDRGGVGALLLFPNDGRVESSERFIPKNFLGQKYLTDAYRVDYISDDQTVQLFIMETDSSVEAESRFSLLEEFYRQRDQQNVALETTDGSPTLVVDGPTKIVIVRVNNRLGGAMGGTVDVNREAATVLAERLNN